MSRRMLGLNECGTVGGMMFGGGKPKYSEKPALVPPSLPEIPHGLPWDLTLVPGRGKPVIT
jgi:hypothetical protein